MSKEEDQLELEKLIHEVGEINGPDAVDAARLITEAGWVKHVPIHIEIREELNKPTYVKVVRGGQVVLQGYIDGLLKKGRTSTYDFN